MIFTFLGKRYSYRYVATLGRDKDGNKVHGKCDDPAEPRKEIIISREVKGREELETHIHEMDHACNWHADEEYIRQCASDKARALWRLGYRKVEPEQPI